MDLLISAGLAAFISGVFTLVVTLLTRRWKKKDEKNEASSSILQKLKEIESKFDAHVKADFRAKAKQNRRVILRFNDEILMSVKHTQDHWQDILAVIDEYEAYCVSDPEFPNNLATMAIANIKETYKEVLRENKFLYKEIKVKEKSA